MSGCAAKRDKPLDKQGRETNENNEMRFYFLRYSLSMDAGEEMASSVKPQRDDVACGCGWFFSREMR